MHVFYATSPTDSVRNIREPKWKETKEKYQRGRGTQQKRRVILTRRAWLELMSPILEEDYTGRLCNNNDSQRGSLFMDGWTDGREQSAGGKRRSQGGKRPKDIKSDDGPPQIHPSKDAHQCKQNQATLVTLQDHPFTQASSLKPSDKHPGLFRESTEKHSGLWRHLGAHAI